MSLARNVSHGHPFERVPSRRRVFHYCWYELPSVDSNHGQAD